MSALVTITGEDDGTWLVSLHGDHDFATRPELARETNPIWATCKIAIIDLSDTGFVDTGVIRWLLDVRRQLEAGGASTLSIVEGPPGSHVDRLFGLMGMRQLLACYATLGDARAQRSTGHGTLASQAANVQREGSRRVA